MIRVWINIGIGFVVLVLLQVLVLNNIHLFGLVTPFLYIYLILKLPVDFGRSIVIFISFLLGLSIDLFSNTFGIHAAAATLAGLVRNPLLLGWVDIREIPENSIPSYKLMDFSKFVRYALIITAIHHTVLFTVESFNFFQPLMMVFKIVSSILFTMLLIGITEAFNLGAKKSGN
ncbi:MAG: rod shape-determining protein MreD [Tannerella sp.]|jgi:rod shape-determining protein MreD|nr:rod shape-determining protein MreD [Tannerella sp.]